MVLKTINNIFFCLFLSNIYKPGVNSVGVNRIKIPLIEINQEHNVISEAGDSVSGRHCDDKCEEIICKVNRVSTFKIM